MKKRSRILAMLVTAAMLASTGCGSSGSSSAESAAAGAVSEAASVVEDAADEAADTAEEAADTVEEAADAAEDAVNEAADAAENAVNEAADSAEDAGADAEGTADADDASKSGEEAEAEEPEVDPDEGYTLIGKKAEGERVYRIVLTNTTGRGITGIQIKDIYAGSYPDSLIEEGDVFADGDVRVLYFDGSEDEEGTEYNVRVTFEDGKMKDMTSYPFGDMEEAQLLFDEDLLHAVYTSLSTGEVTDSLNREKALRQTAADAKAAAARAAAAAKSRKSSGSSSGGKKEVSRQYYDDCDGSGHGYYVITYSDGSTKTVNY